MSKSHLRADRPRWFQLYFLLAAFQLLTVVSGLYLTHRIINGFSNSISMNEQWAARLSRFSGLGHLAALAVAPPNDVFETHDVAGERVKLAAAVNEFRKKLSELMTELKALPKSAESDDLVDDQTARKTQRYAFAREVGRGCRQHLLPSWVAEQFDAHRVLRGGIEGPGALRLVPGNVEQGWLHAAPPPSSDTETASGGHHQ